MRRIPNLASERGAVLIQTAIAALVLVGFGTFVVDYGVLWVARHQAQNAADAGAMAGAIARAYDDFDDPPAAGGVADLDASQVAGANVVWGAPATPGATTYTCPPEVGGSGRCVRVDVYRNDEHGNALPTWFGPVLGIASQGVKATATARVLIANATNCLRPWAIPDKWVEGHPGPDFQRYGLGGALLPSPDFYNPPSSTDAGSGLRFATSNSDLREFGSLVPLTFDDLMIPMTPIYRSSLVPLDFGLPGGYAASVALDSCSGQEIEVGQQIPISVYPPQAQANELARLYDLDSGASWSGTTINDSCAPGCAPLSPRMVAIAVFDVDLFQYRRAVSNWAACLPGGPCPPCPGGAPCVSVVNIVGFFIADSTGSSGYLTSYPGLIPTEAAKLTADSSFLKAITLVR